MSRGLPIFLVMCGGEGKRLWPLSRGKAKQFLTVNGVTMLERTVSRLLPLSGEIGLVLGVDHLVQAQQLVGKYLDYCFVEPKKRNTAVAVAFAVYKLLHLGLKDRPVFFLPCDQDFSSLNSFWKALKQAYSFVSTGKIILFGFDPDKPDPELGYFLSCGERVVQFVEKPDANKAKQLLQKGFWANSGIFGGLVSSFAFQLEKVSPDLVKQLRRYFSTGHGFESLPSDSFDSAVLQKGAECLCVKIDCKVIDLGKVETFSKFNDMSVNNF